jgi:hypothetical protein
MPKSNFNSLNELALMKNEEIIHKFYSAFQKLDYQTMAQCYHPDAKFYDPAFRELDSEEVKAMWKMLCQSATEFSLTYKNVKADDLQGSCDWKANYYFSATKRNVVNQIHASFRFKDGKFIDHRDHFSLWKWSRQALGIPGGLLGWFPPFQYQIHRKAKDRLERFMAKEKL